MSEPIESHFTDLDEGPGVRLRQARERAGLSCQEVAEQLNLTDVQIAMLEAEEYAMLAGPTFVQGYLRSYARLLGLDASPLLEAYRAQRLSVSSTPPVRRRPSLDHGSFQRYLGLAALVLVLVCLWTWQRWAHGEQQTSAVAPVATAPLMAELSDGIMPAPAALGLTPVLESATARAAQTDDSGGALNPALAAPESDAFVAPAPLADPADAEGPVNDHLTLRFSDDCWVEISDASGITLVAELKRANEVLDLRGTAPFNVLLGFAPAVQADFNGRPVVIQADADRHTATLVVGNS